jgi:predicted phosphoadenosine phosphosulfate sulfurtransferase
MSTDAESQTTEPLCASKRPIGINVFQAAVERTAWTFDNFPKVYVSFSGGKDSTAMLHIAATVAREKKRKIGVLCVDLEGQYKLTIEHIREMYELYADIIEPYWVAVPINLRNAVSAYEPQWCCWEHGRENDWVRQPDKMSITDSDIFPFYHYKMEFEEFVPAFGKWYGGGKMTACLVGIRTDESLNRWRTICGGKKQALQGKCWTTWVGESLYNVYPVYDWKTEDIWTFHGKTGLCYNLLYDRMHQAGLTLHQMRICQPYGDDQRKGLWLFHIIEPETWARIVARVNGANQGALYVQESGSILGNIKISKPPGHTWQSFAMLLIESMPPATREHYKDKVAVFLRWYQLRGYPDGIPDAGPINDKQRPSWTRVCKSLLRNDYWCKGLSFSQHKSEAYKKYEQLMKRRRLQWKII